MTAEQKKEFTRKISQANATELIVILYDITLIYMEDAIKDMEEGDIERASIQISLAKKCIEEMIANLHFEYDLATVLHRIYLSMKKSLRESVLQKKNCLPCWTVSMPERSHSRKTRPSFRREAKLPTSVLSCPAPSRSYRMICTETEASSPSSTRRSFLPKPLPAPMLSSCRSVSLQNVPAKLC